MSIDVFGRSLSSSSKVARGPPGIGFNLTEKGDFDLENKKLCNVADPVDEGDAVNLKSLNKSLDVKFNELKQLLDTQTNEINDLKKRRKLSLKKPGVIDSRLKEIEKLLNINRKPDTPEITNNASNSESVDGGAA